MKKISDIFTVTAVVLVLIFGIFIYKGYKKDSKFKNQKLGVSIEIFKSDWGKPNKEFIYKDDVGDILLVYNSNIFFGDKYIFKFDKVSKSLIFKYYDD
ncbi:hypothetical protein [Flavobacterium sp.]|uniref:hypothetical protein n=1 Tax=Flavobacterium sp. TaxID=239 RepID=UPI0037514403